jgi:hypothetical protein
MQTCTVYFRDPQGGEYGHVTAASSLFEAARGALEWFNDPDWQGTRPAAETILEISTVSNLERKYRVRVSDVKRVAPEQTALFKTDSLEAFD